MSLTTRTMCLLSIGLLLAASMPAQAQTEPGIYNPNQSTKTTMYFHINGFQDFPINTQKPDDSYADSPNLGLATHSACIETPGQRFTSQSQHTYYGYSSPSYVEYDFEEDGKPRIHQERGISFDVQLDSSKDVKFTWYLESQVFAGNNDPNPNQIPAVIPGVQMRATIREGDAISVGHAALNTGAVIAQANTEPVTLAGPMTQGTEQVEYIPASDKHIYKFTLDVPIEKNTISAQESYNVRVDFFMDEPGLCPGPGSDGEGDYLMADLVRVHTSPEYRPQMTWFVMNPLRIEYLHPQFIADDLVIHTSTNSPWGNYDVRGDLPSEQAGGGLEVEITGPSTPVNLERVALTARTHEHDHHTEAVDATWVWNYKADNAANGEYTVIFKAKNDQETANATAIAKFEIGTGKITGCGNQATGESATCEETEQLAGKQAAAEDAPGIGMVVLLGAIAALGVVLRRRH